MIKDRTGEVYTFSDGRTMEIIKYYNTDDITVVFNDMSIVCNQRYSKFKIGQIKNWNNPIVCNIGFVGYGYYIPKNYKYIYNIWRSMIQRCYSNLAQSNQKSYIGCTVNPDWHNFQNFARWFDKNYIKGFELDKDILFKGNKVYSSKTCCFVPKDINVLLTTSKKTRGKYVIGVFKFKKCNKFSAQISIDGKNIYLGSFNTELEAFNAYKIAKKENIKKIVDKFKHQITSQCYNALINWKIDIND